MSEKKYIIFEIRNQPYAVDIMSVSEITNFIQSVEVPNAPSFIFGIINLREMVVPVISLSARLGVPQTTNIAESKIIVANHNDCAVGYLVDHVRGIIIVDDEKIEETPMIIRNNKIKFIEGVAKVDENMIIVMNFQKVLSVDELNQIENMDINQEETDTDEIQDNSQEETDENN